MTVISTDTIETHIPYYLTAEQKEGLVKALSEFHDRPIDYYINKYADEMLQGDGWRGLEVVRFEDGARNEIKGIVLSNSCDIAPGNPRDITNKIVFAPIVRLSSYAERLKATGLTDQQIGDKFRVIREQNVTAIFYLPRGGALDDDYIAILDDIHTMPSKAFGETTDHEKLFTLSMVGFYLFILKLSVHFCRLHEEVVR